MQKLTKKETEPEHDPTRIKETINNFQQIITSAAYKSKVFPENWQKAIVIPIPKLNKCKLNPNSYRLIANTIK